MSALRHPSQREEMSAHCRHPERVSAKDPVIFYAVMPVSHPRSGASGIHTVLIILVYFLN